MPQLPPPPPPSTKENAVPAGPPVPGAGYGYDAGVYAQMYNMQYYQALIPACTCLSTDFNCEGTIKFLDIAESAFSLYV